MRALRRHHRQRMVKKAIKKVTPFYCQKHKAVLAAKKLADNMTTCSSYCCGNPRNNYRGRSKLTMAELKFLEYCKHEG